MLVTDEALGVILGVLVTDEALGKVAVAAVVAAINAAASLVTSSNCATTDVKFQYSA